jgi:hypothetical protein
LERLRVCGCRDALDFVAKAACNLAAAARHLVGMHTIRRASEVTS